MKKLTAKDIAMIGVMVATIEAAKAALSLIPGLEIVSLLIVLYTLTFGTKIYYALVVFVILEGLLNGFGIWWFMYVYTWPLLSFFVRLCRQNQSLLAWCTLLGLFGLCFGALCSIPYYFAGGIGTAFAWWISGIPVDIFHGISNFILCLILFRPLKQILDRITIPSA